MPGSRRRRLVVRGLLDAALGLPMIYAKNRIQSNLPINPRWFAAYSVLHCAVKAAGYAAMGGGAWPLAAAASTALELRMRPRIFAVPATRATSALIAAKESVCWLTLGVSTQVTRDRGIALGAACQLFGIGLFANTLDVLTGRAITTGCTARQALAWGVTNRSAFAEVYLRSLPFRYGFSVAIPIGLLKLQIMVEDA